MCTPCTAEILYAVHLRPTTDRRGQDRCDKVELSGQFLREPSFGQQSSSDDLGVGDEGETFDN
jgi:hypothetical protein